MKKLFTFAAAVLASVTMMAQTITLAEVTPESNWYGVEGVGRVANKSGNAFSSPDMSCAGITGFKTGSSYFTIQTYADISSIVVGAQSGSNRTVSAITVSDDLKSSAQSTSNVEYQLIGGSETYAVVSNACGNEFTVNFNSPVSANSYIQIVLNGNVEVFAVTFGSAAPVTDPVAQVTIAGPEACFVNQKASYEATTDVKANAYKWFVDGVEQDGATTKAFEFTPAAVGTYAISCSAKNDNNSDFVASNVINLVVTERQDVEQVDVTEATTWDWTKAASVKEIKWTGDQKDAEPVVLANVDGMNNDANFNSQALLFSGEYPVRDGKYCQGSHIQFHTTVAGYVQVDFSNTGGGDRPNRYVAVNGVVNTTVGSSSTTKVSSAYIPVDAGDVKIEGSFEEYTAGEPQYLRIYKLVFGTGNIPTAINNIEAAVKAVKMVRNGQLFIEKNGVVYNAQGTIVR